MKRAFFFAVVFGLASLAPGGRARLDAGDDDPLIKLRDLSLALVRATQAKDAPKVATLVKGLALPDHEAWFKKTFGDEKGALLEKDYAKTLDGFDKKMSQVFEDLVASGHTSPAENRLDGPDASGKSGREMMAVAAMKVRVPLFVVHFSGPGKKGDHRLGSFVLVDGSLRFVGKLEAVSAGAKSPWPDEVDVTPD